MERSADELQEPLANLPPVEFAFAYGSGVFKQPLVDAESNVPMTDYIVAVASPSDWHSENLMRNPGHYSSCLRNFGAKAVAATADQVGVGVHFNTLVPWNDKVWKYGVMSTARLVSDLLRWDALYIGGRLQKPVRVLVDVAGVGSVNRVNLQAALAAALLLLPESFTEVELYTAVCGISYRGDIRMLFAEDPAKVRRIVQGSFRELQQLYALPALHMAASGLLDLPPVRDTLWRQDMSPAARLVQVSSLPSGILNKLAKRVGVSYCLDIPGDHAQEIGELVVKSKKMEAMLQKCIMEVVRASSLRQAASAFLAAGSANAARYLGLKLQKAWRR